MRKHPTPRRALPALPLLIALALAPGGCNVDTSRLPPIQRQALGAEGILHEGANLVFRHTQRTEYSRTRWRDVVASIVVTKQTVLIHRNGRELLRITARTRRFCQLIRIGPRLRIQVAGSNASEIWSFIPPHDPAAWTKDVRSVLLLVGAGSGVRAPAGP